MTMKLYDLQPTAVTKDRYETLFTRKDLGHLQGYDLARGADRPGGSTQSFQRTGGVEPR